MQHSRQDIIVFLIHINFLFYESVNHLRGPDRDRRSLLTCQGIRDKDLPTVPQNIDSKILGKCIWTCEDFSLKVHLDLGGFFLNVYLDDLLLLLGFTLHHPLLCLLGQEITAGTSDDLRMMILRAREDMS